VIRVVLYSSTDSLRYRRISWSKSPASPVLNVDAEAFQMIAQNGFGLGEAEPTAAVLIVGTGPAGLFAACELLGHGIKPRVVERRLAPHHEARGTALQPATLDIIERAGLIEPFLRAGVRIRQVQLLGPGHCGRLH
jgi:hypothetical protein